MNDCTSEETKGKIVNALARQSEMPRFNFFAGRGNGNTLMQLAAKPDIFILHAVGLIPYCRHLCLKHKIKEPRFAVAGSWDDVKQITCGISRSYDVDHYTRDVFHEVSWKKVSAEPTEKAKANGRLWPDKIPLD